MRVFITGATGYIGMNVALALRRAGHEIAERGVAGYDDAIRYRLAEGFGDVLMLRPWVRRR